MNKIILIIFSLILTTSIAFCSTTKAYDKYGTKTGSYKTNGSVTTSYDRHGSKTGTIKHTSKGYTTYDKYGSKTGTAKKTSTGYTTYNKYGSKTGTYKTNSNGTTTKYDKTVKIKIFYLSVLKVNQLICKTKPLQLWVFYM